MSSSSHDSSTPPAPRGDAVFGTGAGASQDKALFTPGPLTTSATVKAAMLRDLGSRDEAFLDLVRDVRRRLLALAGVPDGASPSAFTALPLQGSGTYGVEAMVTTALPRTGGRLLVLVNGAYGARLAEIARVAAIEVEVLVTPENEAIDPAAVARALAASPATTHVALVHCETTTGILNPLEEVARVVAAAGRSLLVDAMSSFGALAIDLATTPVDWLVSSANKCIEGVPGFCFVLARRSVLETCGPHARSVSLDLFAQWRALEANGQFRFTPPTHAFLAFRQALDELDAEGGREARRARYAANQARIVAGMVALGFQVYLDPAVQSPIITTFRYPEHPAFRFEAFYRGLSERGFAIYPGKLTDAACFRIGSVGHIELPQVEGLLAAVPQVLRELGCELEGGVRS